MDQNGRVRSLLELKPETDKILAAIVMKCLEPDPEKDISVQKSSMRI